jgi:hypothetical protein
VESIPYIGSSTAGLSLGYVSYVYGNITAAVTSSNTSGAGHNHPITMSVQYCDIILASKN